MTKTEAIAKTLSEYTGEKIVEGDFNLSSGNVRLRSRNGLGEGEEWAVMLDSRMNDEDAEGFLVFARFNRSEGGWVVLEDEVEEVCFTQWPPRRIH